MTAGRAARIIIAVAAIILATPAIALLMARAGFIPAPISDLDRISGDAGTAAFHGDITASQAAAVLRAPALDDHREADIAHAALAGIEDADPAARPGEGKAWRHFAVTTATALSGARTYVAQHVPASCDVDDTCAGRAESFPRLVLHIDRLGDQAARVDAAWDVTPAGARLNSYIVTVVRTTTGWHASAVHPHN